MSRPVLVVFLKAPEPGKVKTRLAESVGPIRAAELYSQWIGDVFVAVQAVRSSMSIVGYYAGAGLERFREWESFADRWIEQPAGDLGARLESAFSLGSPCIAIGTDCLDLTSDHILQATSKLAEFDVVLGPATDGGYYLIGTANPSPGMFANIRWSTAHAMADQICRCSEMGLTIAVLDELADIDTEADWLAWKSRRGSRWE